MSRALFILNSQATKMQAHKLIENAPYGTRVEFKKQKRTLPQNDKLWSMLTDISSQIVWHGKKLPPSDWKLVFMAALRKELRIVPNIDGSGFVNLGTSSSDLSKEEISDLFEVINNFAAEHGVTFKGGE